jgi:hypothetical protein
MPRRASASSAATRAGSTASAIAAMAESFDDPMATRAHDFLVEHQRLATSGARAVVPFERAGLLYMAVPQFSSDVEGQKAGMHAGDSDIDSVIYRWQDGRFVEDSKLPVSGAEDIEFFEIGNDAFLAVSSARTGHGPYESNSVSKIFKWNGRAWAEHQAVPGLVAKQWRHFSFDGRHFLALALGITGDAVDARHPRESCIFEWNGKEFVAFQTLDGRWGYNWCYFELAGERFLGYADHVSGSRIYRWDGARFVPFQELAERGGRSFSLFEASGTTYLAFANILADSVLYRWNGASFIAHQTLPGPGGREFAQIKGAQGFYLVRINFIEGTPAAPKVDLQSQIYRYANGALVPVQQFATFGGTSAASFTAGGQIYLAVSNSLTPELRFRQDTVVYRFIE